MEKKGLEKWKPIKGYNNYSVSNIGNVRNDNTGKILKSNTSSNGYKSIGLSSNNVKKTHTIHRLVAEAFLENPQNKDCIDHKNNDKFDNKVSNLRFATYTENNLNKITQK